MKKVRNILKKIIDFIYALMADNAGVYAAQASFFLIISVIPLCMLIFSIVNIFLSIDQKTILSAVDLYIPAQISEFVTTILNELFYKSSSVPVISITAVSTLWLASRGIMGLYMGLSNVYHAPMRNWFVSRFISVIYTLALIATLIVTIIFFGFGNKVEQFLVSRSIILSDIFQFLLRGKILIFMAYLTVLFALFYTFLPHRKTSFKKQLPGAAFAAAGWMVFSFIYSIYINNFSNYSYVYGSLTALVFLMLWLYFCMNIFLYGAQINKMIENRNKK
ncbi:MAG: YihY/virulence factor BrkB family protein [Oscillospiraceae bacterium]|nr:YihY/virulence factor BrkB family protein [Oscillospiraceae bacterium]